MRWAWLVAVVVLSACAAQPAVPSADPPVSSAPAARVAEVSVELIQYRRDVPRDVIQVKVSNQGPEPIHVEQLTVDSDTFVAPVTAEKDSRIDAGAVVDLPIPLGEPACESQDGRSQVALVIEGVESRHEADDEVLRRIQTRRCAEQDIARLVTLAWDPTWVDAGEVRGEPALRGRLLVEPVTAVETLTVGVAEPTTLFTVAKPAELETAAPTSLDVVLTVTRCDPHAVAEDKVGYLIPVTVGTQDSEPVRVKVAVPVAERGPLQDLIDRTCR